MLSEMTAEQFAEWQAFYREEPFGADVENYRAGVVAATVANVNGVKRTPSDFFPRLAEPRREQESSVAEQAEAVFGVLAARKG